MYFILKSASFPDTIGNIEVTAGEVGSGGSSDGGSTSSTCTFTVKPSPSTATVTLTASGYTTVSGTGNQSIVVASGTTVSYTVSADGYVTKQGSKVVSITSSQTITLTAEGSGSEGDDSTPPSDSTTGITNYALPYTEWNWKSGFGTEITVNEDSFSWSGIADGTNVVFGHKYNLADIPFKVGDTFYFGIRDLVKTGGNYSLCFMKADGTEITPRLNGSVTSPISYLTKVIPEETAVIQIRFHGSSMSACSAGKAYLSTVEFDENTVWAN